MELNFEQYGNRDSPALVTIVMHGWANSLETIKPFAQQLANYGPVYSIDLPGHGKSPIPEEVWGMREFAEELKRFLDQRGLNKVNLLGHSFGGKTAIKFSAAYPELVNKVVLIGASGLRPKPTLKKRLRAEFLKYLRLFIRFKNTAIGARIYRDWYIPRFASRDYLNAGPMTKTFVKTVNEELHDELAAIKAQALLIWGELDDESTISVAQQMKKLLPAATLITLPNQGHYPFVGSSAPLVVKYVRDFLWDVS
jgi:pimeloyl-ACP methyl ester carboxylesterase